MSRVVYKTPEEFKAVIKVGDYLTAWSTEKVVQVTAFGQKNRFLGVDVFGEERVQTMTAHTGWEKVNEPEYWKEDEL